MSPINGGISLAEGYSIEGGKRLAETNEKDFIVKPDGSKDFGYISNDIEEESGGMVKSAPVRLQVGSERTFGYLHVLRHEEQIINKGFANALEHIEYILSNFAQTYSRQSNKKPNRFVLYCQDTTKGFMPIDLEFEKGNDDYYTIISAMPHKEK